jgi:hypothetical protein
MATWNEVDAVASSFPILESDQTAGSRSWSVAKMTLAWERPLRKKEIETELASGREPYLRDIVAFHIPEVAAKQAYLQNFPAKFFEIPHFAGYPAILCRLSELTTDDLEELLFEAYLCRAPKKLAAQLQDERERNEREQPGR